MKKVIGIILSAVGSFILIVVIIFMISAVRSMNNGEPTFILGHALGIVPTDSMIGDNEDSLDVNDMYIIQRASIDEVEIGDVIIYKGTMSPNSDNQILIVHRIVDKTDEGFVTQGDNENEPDQPLYQDYITKDNIIGKFDYKITYLKPISALVQSNRSFIFLALIIVIAILLVTEIVDLMKTHQKDKNDKLEKAHQHELQTLKDQMKQDILQEIKNENKRE